MYVKKDIEKNITSILAIYGLKKTRDYTISKGKLYLKSVDTKSKILSAFERFYPNFSYYWETPRILCWF